MKNHAREIELDYETAKLIQEAQQTNLKALSGRLQEYPRGAAGLTPDSVKFSPEYRLDKQAFDDAFRASREFNTRFNKAFAKEIKAERRARRALA